MDGMTWEEIARHAAMLVESYKKPTHLNGNAQWIVADVDENNFGTYYLAGTNDPLDWINNATLAEHYDPHVGNCHLGFYRHAQMVLEAFTVVPRLVVGHSLGGAAAQLIAAKCGARCLTFGSPRPWQRGGTIGLRQHIRIAHRGDPVAYVPTFCRWQHWETSLHQFGWPTLGKGMLSRLAKNHWMGGYRDHCLMMAKQKHHSHQEAGK